MNCAEEVRGLRKDMGLNRRQFCEYFEIPYRTVYDWEAGHRHCPEYVVRLMEYKAKTEMLVK